MADELQNSFMHVGVGHNGNPPGRGSGVLPWGYGKRPYQSLEGTPQYAKLMKNRNKSSGASTRSKSTTHARNGDSPSTNIHETTKEKAALKRADNELSRNIARANAGSAAAKQYLARRNEDLKLASGRVKADDRRRARLKIDLETGFHIRDTHKDEVEFRKALRQKEYRLEESSVVKREIDSKNVNPGFSEYDVGTTQNCCLCGLTNEMRQRGYDVRAKKLAGGMGWEQLGRIFKGLKPSWIPQSPEGSEEETAAKLGSNKAMNDRINKYISAQPDGSRGIVNVHRFDGSGHVISYEIVNKKPIYTDSQVGISFTPKNSMLFFGESTSCAFGRLDNLTPNLSRLKEVCE